MSTPVIERLTEIQDKVVESVSSFQDPVVETVRKAVDLAEERIPEFPTESVTAGVPTAREFVDNQFDFANRMLKVSHDFVISIIDAVEPVTVKVVKPAKPVVAKKTPKAA
jgi:hypothetical protein